MRKGRKYSRNPRTLAIGPKIEKATEKAQRIFLSAVQDFSSPYTTFLSCSNAKYLYIITIQRASTSHGSLPSPFGLRAHAHEKMTSSRQTHTLKHTDTHTYQGSPHNEDREQRMCTMHTTRAQYLPRTPETEARFSNDKYHSSTHNYHVHDRRVQS